MPHSRSSRELTVAVQLCTPDEEKPIESIAVCAGSGMYLPGLGFRL
jgi:hypothetical protein